MNTLKAMAASALDSLSHSFNLLWSTISPILLPLVFTLVFLGVGLIVANAISDKVGFVVKKTKIDALLDKILAPVLKITGTKINSAVVIGSSIKWFLVALVLIAGLDLADLHGVIAFLKQGANYLPNVFISALILIAGSLLANLAATIVGFVSKNGFPIAAKVAVNTLAFIAALTQLVTPIIGSLSQFVGNLNLSKLQGDVLVIGILVIALVASKNAITKTVESLYKN